MHSDFRQTAAGFVLTVIGMQSERQHPEVVHADRGDAEAPLRVALCLSGEPLTLLQACLTRAGHQAQPFPAQALTQLSALTPPADIAIVDHAEAESAGAGSALSALAAVSSVMPVVLITSGIAPRHDLQRERVCAVALLPRPVDSATLLVSLPVWVQRHREAMALRAREAKLLSALQSSRQISTAVGMLAQRHHLSVDAAFERLRLKARSRRLRMADVAQGLLDETQTWA
jgi:AmiR/NasT family two-component response regulator